MKHLLLLIGGCVFFGLLIIGYKLNSDFNTVEDSFHSKHNLDDSSFVILKELISPDEKHKMYEYQFDNGGFGYSRVFWSVIPNEPTEKDLRNGLLPYGYKAIGWTEENLLVIEKWEPYYYNDDNSKTHDITEINNVRLILK